MINKNVDNFWFHNVLYGQRLKKSNFIKMNINHKVLKEGTKNTEKDGIKLSELGFVGLKDFGIYPVR
jgi:hypothetical protein